MNPYRPGPSRSRGLADRMERRPLTTRLILMLVAFLLLIPIAGIIRGSGTNVVKSGGLPGAAVGADPLLTATTVGVAGGAATSLAAGGPAGSAAPAVPSSTTTPSTAAADASGADLTAQATSPPTTAKKKTPTTPAATAASKKTATSPATTAAKKAPATTAAPKATAPPTTRAPATTVPAPPKTQAPTTTEAPAAAPPPNRYSKAEVEAIIRSIWPADLADEAVRIARRESNLVPTVRNWCCFGLFQIYFEMNKKTLAAAGVTAAEQLYDPRVNTEAAYAIYQRSGWAPWSA
jgi:hypothetical protein